MIPVKDTLNTLHKLYNDFVNEPDKHKAMSDYNNAINGLNDELKRDDFFQNVYISYAQRINAEMDI